MTIYLKPDVEEEGVQREMWFALGAMAMSKFLLFGESNVVVTAMRDGQHMAGSLHPQGEAEDIRSLDLLPGDANRVLVLLKHFLGPLGFDVVMENIGGESTAPHFHLEYQPKGDERFLTRLPRPTPVHT